MGETTRVSAASDGSQASGRSVGPSISGNGRYVVFSSRANNLVADGTNECHDWSERHCPDAFVHDRETGDTTRVSVSSNGSEGDSESGEGISISRDGRYVVFESLASNLA